MTDECPHGGDYYSCPPCQRSDGELATLRPPAETIPYGSSTVAKYPGTCNGCGFDVRPGERITLRRRGWTHSACTDPDLA